MLDGCCACAKDELEDEWDALQADVAAETASALPSAPVAARPTADLGAIGGECKLLCTAGGCIECCC